MSRMLEARAELSLRPSFDLPRTDDNTNTNDMGESTSSSLAKRLMEIFQFRKSGGCNRRYVTVGNRALCFR
jgi:sterol 3beta-glucosyltransferase